MSHGCIRDRYPVFNAYPGQQEFLDNESAIAGSVEDRIRSTWPFIVRRVLAFQKTLRPRERVNFDPEDTLAELWVAVARKDGQWSPERGRYITFAAVVIDRELSSIRDRARTVESPRNSSCRMKKYRQEEEAGVLTERRRKTANDIRRTADGTTQMASRGDTNDDGYVLEPLILDDPATTLINREMADETTEGLRAAIQQLSPVEAEVLVRVAGLWGREPESVQRIAEALGRNEPEVRRIKSRARLGVRKYLTAINHPAAASQLN